MNNANDKQLERLQNLTGAGVGCWIAVGKYSVISVGCGILKVAAEGFSGTPEAVNQWLRANAK